ncbi:MAG: aminoglycoside phosphotransferase family protein [Steroidobacteraceae bacterium]
MGVLDASDSRLAALTQWVVDDLGFAGSVIAPASVDASFRRYFRVTRDADTYIVMDAPPAKEDVAPFVKVAKLLAGIDVNVPLILARDLERGFLLLSDLGSRQYLDELGAANAADRLYADALASLQKMQTADAGLSRTLPRYDRILLVNEMQLMPEWFLRRHLGVSVLPHERAMLDALFESLVHSAAAQPGCFVHRDYHSRNLLLCAENNPGILDFQDAVWGPITYDLASLLKDCYIAWPAPRVRAWALNYREQLLAAGVSLPGNAAEFMRWFDLMGLQRHIKVLGIFSRLYYRDGKPQYLLDLPRVLQYAKDAAAAYEETQEFAEFIAARIEPQFPLAQKRALA